MKKILTTTALILSALLILGGCAAPQAADDEPLKIALLPVLDTLPVHIAEANGYFADEGITVEVIPVSSPVERDQLMQAGEIDGMLTELTTVGIFNRDAAQVQIVSYARAADADAPVFRVLSAPASGIATPTDLAGVPIGVSKNTVIEYITERLLQEEGVAGDEILTESVPVIPERFQLLMSGEILAATLPDPLAQAAIEAGANLVIDDSAYPAYSSSSLAFSVEAIEDRAETIAAFMRAWNRAVADLNADPEAYRALFLEKVPVPESVQETYEIRPFPLNELPDETQWDDAMAWLIEKGLLDEASSYAEAINTDFIE